MKSGTRANRITIDQSTRSTCGGNNMEEDEERARRRGKTEKKKGREDEEEGQRFDQIERMKEIVQKRSTKRWTAASVVDFKMEDKLIKFSQKVSKKSRRRRNRRSKERGWTGKRVRVVAILESKWKWRWNRIGREKDEKRTMMTGQRQWSENVSQVNPV